MKKNLLSVFVLAASFLATAQTQTFNYIGSVQTFTVPPCVSSVTIQASGAQGGLAAIGGTAGLGGSATGALAVTPGDILYIYVGGTNGYNGGGAGAVNGNPVLGVAGSGGGASDVRLNGTAIANRVIVAGGGGGAASNGTWPGCQVAGPAGNGGAGGGLTGGTGTFGVGNPCNCAGGGGAGATGGSQVAGGIHGNYNGNTACLRSNWTAGLDGTLAQGGNGSLVYYNGTGGGGGGGGGYYGGGAGGSGSDTTPGGGGGGGSSWTGTCTSASTNSGTQTGNGQVVLTYTNSSSVPASPASISGSNSVCVGASITFSISTVVGATSYTWTVPSGSTIVSGQTTTSITVTAGSTSGNVTVAANNSCGSSAPTLLALTINPLPIITITPSSATICSGSSTALTASGASTYVWSSGGTTATENVSPLSMTTYTVTGTSVSGCVNTATVMVMVNALPTVTANSTSSTVCFGSGVILTGGGASTYTWDNSVVNAVSFVPAATTTYMVTGTDINGCSNTASIIVTVNPLPIVTTSVTSSTICNGAADTLMASGASTYAWSSGGNTAIEIVTPNTNTTYTVTGTDANGCVNTNTISVIVNPTPTVTATAATNPICEGSGTTLMASGASTYLWMPLNQTGSSVTDIPVATTTYSVTGTDANGCIGIGIVTLTVNPRPVLDATASPMTICAGDSSTITATGAANYIWQPGGLTTAVAIVTPSSTTTYTVMGTDLNGCTNTDSVTVTVNALPVLTLSSNNSSPCVNDGVVSLTGLPGGGTWSGPGVTGNNFNPTTAGVGAQILTYNFIDLNTGCSNSSILTINVNACVGIIETTFANGINVFPNPAAGVFTLSVNANVGDLNIVITDATGRIVYSSNENNVVAGFTKQINLENVAAGIYLLKLNNGTEQNVQQISIIK